MTKHDDHFPFRHILRLIAAAAVVVLGACGGGGDDEGAAAPEAGDGSTPSTSSDTDDPGGSGSPAAWADDKCSIVSADDVGAAVGEPVSARDYPPFGCQYTGTDPVSRTAVVIDYFSDSFECEGIESRDADAEVVQGLGAHAVNGESRAVAEAVLASAGRSS